MEEKSKVDWSNFNIKRFVIYNILGWIFAYVLSFCLIFFFNYEAPFQFLSIMIPMLAAMDAGQQYAIKTNNIFEKSITWSVGLKLNWISLLIQIAASLVLLGIAGGEPLLSIANEMGLGLVLIVVFVVVAILFLVNWVAIRWALNFGAKNYLKIEERKAQKTHK